MLSVLMLSWSEFTVLRVKCSYTVAVPDFQEVVVVVHIGTYILFFLTIKLILSNLSLITNLNKIKKNNLAVPKEKRLPTKIFKKVY